MRRPSDLRPLSTEIKSGHTQVKVCAECEEFALHQSPYIMFTI